MTNIKQKLIVGGSFSTLALAGALGILTISSNSVKAATDRPVQTEAKDTTIKADPSRGGHVGKNGKKEELLTGDTAEKVKAAALSAVSGGTIERVETDAEGDVYEAHMKKADGSRTTVKLDANFQVTKTE